MFFEASPNLEINDSLSCDVYFEMGFFCFHISKIVLVFKGYPSDVNISNVTKVISLFHRTPLQAFVCAWIVQFPQQILLGFVNFGGQKITARNEPPNPSNVALVNEIATDGYSGKQHKSNKEPSKRPNPAR